MSKNKWKSIFLQKTGFLEIGLWSTITVQDIDRFRWDLGGIEGTRPQIKPIAGGPNPLTASIFFRAEYDFPKKSITPEPKSDFDFQKWRL